MRIRRSFPIVLGVLLVAAVITLLVQLRKHAPPEPARLLPAADGFVYVNLKWMRRANITGQLPEVSHDPAYEQFIQATDFQFERDLDQAAFAIHYPPPEAKPGAPQETRFSEVFVARIHGERLRAYLAKISSSVESYRSVDIYSIPLEGRTLRVAILGVDTVAASNHPDPLLIRGMIDRSRKLASPFGGPALLRQYYKQVPFTSLAWGIFKINPALLTPSVGFVLSPAVVVVSARYLGNVHLRAEAFTASAEDAKRIVEQLSTFLTVFHSAENAVAAQGTDPDVKTFLDSLSIEQHDERAVLTAKLPPGFIRKALSEAPKEAAPQPSASPAAPPAGAKPRP